MTLQRPLVHIALGLLTAMPLAAPANPLFKHEQSCLKLPPSQERTDCIKKQREMERDRRDSERKEGGKQKNDLCFTRKATNEVVCPN